MQQQCLPDEQGEEEEQPPLIARQEQTIVLEVVVAAATEAVDAVTIDVAADAVAAVVPTHVESVTAS